MRRLLLLPALLLLPTTAARAAEPGEEARITLTPVGASWVAAASTPVLRARVVAARDGIVVAMLGTARVTRLRLFAQPGQAIEVGAYAGAVAPEARAPGQPGIELRGTFCGRALTGSFAITDLRVDPETSAVVRLRATFEVACPTAPGVVRGEVRLLARAATETALARDPATLEWGGAALPDGGAAWNRRTRSGRNLTARVRIADGSVRTLPKPAIVTDARAGLLIATRTRRGRRDDVVAHAYPSLAARAVPRGINTKRAEYGATTDGRRWQFARVISANVTELRLLDARSGRQSVLARGRDLVTGAVRGGVSAWAVCPPSLACRLKVRTLATGRTRTFAPPGDRAYYSVGVADDGSVYAALGPARTCGIAEIYRVAPGAARPVAVARGRGDVTTIHVARVGTVDRLVLGYSDCRRVGFDQDAWQVDVDPSVLVPLVAALPPA